MPFAGPVSFLGFMLLGPALLIVLRVYLQIYVEHSERLERLARLTSMPRAPMLVPFHNPLIRYFSGLIFYLLLPLTMLLFAWKAAVFPRWGSGLLCVAVAVIASHLMLPARQFSWRFKALLSAGAAFVVVAIIIGAGPVRRPFALFRANLSGQWLNNEDLRDAYLYAANLTGAALVDANLTGADLEGVNLSNAYLQNARLANARLFGANLTAASLINAKLTGARLNRADLTAANLYNARLTGARLNGADLTGADLENADLISVDLRGANLNRARNLTQNQLAGACGDEKTKLPEGLMVRPCPATALNP